jgi:hypothetical protein
MEDEVVPPGFPKRALVVVRKNYYGIANAVEPMYEYLTRTFEELGTSIVHFDHYLSEAEGGKEQASEMLQGVARAGHFDVMVYQTTGTLETEPIYPDALAEIRGFMPTVAWNSDDDWQTPGSLEIADYVTWLVTTYPRVFEAHRQVVGNLRLSQWACLERPTYAGPKDIDFGFAGTIYASRNGECRELRRRANLQCFGRGGRIVSMGLPVFRGAFRFPFLTGPALTLGEIQQVWDRSRISFTPLRGGPNGTVMSLKGRLFEMGLSRTLMLCDQNQDIDLYYEPGREYVSFENLDDCVEKVAWYLNHHQAWEEIVENYAQRTRNEHLWSIRLKQLFRDL